VVADKVVRVFIQFSMPFTLSAGKPSAQLSSSRVMKIRWDANNDNFPPQKNNNFKTGPHPFQNKEKLECCYRRDVGDDLLETAHGSHLCASNKHIFSDGDPTISNLKLTLGM